MSDLKLVPPNQPTPFERMLLDAAANESPSAEQRIRVRQALGLGAVVSMPPPVVQTGRAAALGKVAIGGFLAASAIIAVVLLGSGRHPASVSQTARSQTPAQQAAAPARALGPTPLAVEPVVSPLPRLEPTSDPAAANLGTNAQKSAARSASSVSRAPAPADGASDLGEQLRLIDAARAAVAAGNPSGASQALSTYNAKFPRGSFGQEAAVLHIEALDMQGNHGRAAALARSFLAQHPNSPHVSLVQRVATGAQ